MHSRIVAEHDHLVLEGLQLAAEDTRCIWGRELRQRKQASRMLGGASTTDTSDRETIVHLAVYKLVLAYLWLTRQQCRSRLLQRHI